MLNSLKRSLSCRQLGMVETYHKIAGVSALDTGIDARITDAVTRAGKGEYNVSFKVFGLQNITMDNLTAISPNVILQCTGSNHTSVDVKARTVLAIAAVKASKIIEDLTFTADTAGSAGNSISLEYENGSSTASLTVKDVEFMAVDSGSAGNSITIALVAGGTQGSEVASVVGTAISISMDDGNSTAQNICDAINNSVAASALVAANLLGSPSDPQDAAVAAPLAGGGVIQVGVAGSVITVGIDEGVSTASQIKTAIEASGAAAALVDISISGTGSDIQSIQGPTNLAGGDGAYSEGDLIDADFYMTVAHSLRLSTNS